MNTASVIVITVEDLKSVDRIFTFQAFNIAFSAKTLSQSFRLTSYTNHLHTRSVAESRNIEENQIRKIINNQIQHYIKCIFTNVMKDWGEKKKRLTSRNNGRHTRRRRVISQTYTRLLHYQAFAQQLK